MIKKILIASDGSESSEEAGKFAVDMASQLGCEIHYLYVADAMEQLAGMNLAEEFLALRSAIVEGFKKEGKTINAKLKEFAERKGIKTSCSIMEGENPAKEIIDTAQRINADLIIIGSLGKTSPVDFFIGNIAARLLHADLPCPITIVKTKK